METTLTGIEPIPVEYILSIAQSKATPAQRRPYIDLIERWGDKTGCTEEARQLLKRLREGQVIDPQKMPCEFMPRYRQPEVAEKLIEIVRQINAIIASKQEKWTYSHWNELNIHCHVGTIGAVFDFYAGTAKRAPIWWQEHSLEWLYRLLKEPRRMWRRYVIGNPLFLWNITKERLCK